MPIRIPDALPARDTLLREGVFVDLYPIVRRALRVGSRSYSIKKLEPLYMGEHLRAGDVTDAGASVVAYADYAAHRDADEPEQARRILASIADYNEYDCLSTLRLRNWLLDLAGRDAAAEACAHLHARGILHGDLYGHNILWDGTDGAAVVSDFGAASTLPAGPAGAAKPLPISKTRSVRSPRISLRSAPAPMQCAEVAQAADSE